ncbi:hypothetical protein P4478_06400 [Bacillus subtilis]|nr:hypothetical protein [Bacillus subtilis]
MENKLLINNANTVFEKKDDKYFGYKSRFGDIVIGGAYSYRFVVHYAKTNQDVVIVPGDVNKATTPVCTTLEERLWKPEKSAQARRDEIVEQAKADVEKLTEETQADYFWLDCDVNFIVNRSKRTVVMLLKGGYTGDIYARGIAKAAPNDCFNAHIGKAIALRRALGLAVPDEYLNAPQSTEVRVGDVVEFQSVYKAVERALVVSDDESTGEGKITLGSAYADIAKVIDDSREEVGGE